MLYKADSFLAFAMRNAGVDDCKYTKKRTHFKPKSTKKDKGKAVN